MHCTCKAFTDKAKVGVVARNEPDKSNRTTLLMDNDVTTLLMALATAVAHANVIKDRVIAEGAA